MKIIKSLILTLILASATFAGEIPQFDPAPPNPAEMPQVAPAPTPAANQQATNDTVAKIVVAIIQNLLPLR
jgi:hypothetical protein